MTSKIKILDPKTEIEVTKGNAGWMELARSEFKTVAKGHWHFGGSGDTLYTYILVFTLIYKCLY